VAALYNIPLQPTYQHLQPPQLPQQQQQQQQQVTNHSAAAAPAAGDDTGGSGDSSSDREDPAAGDEGLVEEEELVGELQGKEEEEEEEEDGFLSSYHRGGPRPVSGVALANQARAAAIALVRFGDSIPLARKRQLEGIVARYVGRWVCVRWERCRVTMSAVMCGWEWGGVVFWRGGGGAGCWVLDRQLFQCVVVGDNQLSADTRSVQCINSKPVGNPYAAEL